MDDIKAWKKEAKRLNDPSLAKYDKNLLPTNLLPENVVPEIIIKNCLRLKPPNHTTGFEIVEDRLFFHWILNDRDCDVHKLIELAGDVVCALQNHYFEALAKSTGRVNPQNANEVNRLRELQENG